MARTKQQVLDSVSSGRRQIGLTRCTTYWPIDGLIHTRFQLSFGLLCRNGLVLAPLAEVLSILPASLAYQDVFVKRIIMLCYCYKSLLLASCILTLL